MGKFLIISEMLFPVEAAARLQLYSVKKIQALKVLVKIRRLKTIFLQVSLVYFLLVILIKKNLSQDLHYLLHH